MSTATVDQDLTGTFNVDPVHSTFGFVVNDNGVSRFRGHFEQVDAKLEGGALTGTAYVDSVKTAIRSSRITSSRRSSSTPPRRRRSSSARHKIRVADDGSAEIDGELTYPRRDQARHGEGQRRDRAT